MRIARPIVALLIVLLGVIKLPLAALMLWLPLRHDETMSPPQLPDSSEDDGGSQYMVRFETVTTQRSPARTAASRPLRESSRTSRSCGRR